MEYIIFFECPIQLSISQRAIHLLHAFTWLISPEWACYGHIYSLDTQAVGHIGGWTTACISTELWTPCAVQTANRFISATYRSFPHWRLGRAAYKSMPYLDPYAVFSAANVPSYICVQAAYMSRTRSPIYLHTPPPPHSSLACKQSPPPINLGLLTSVVTWCVKLVRAG